MSFQTTLDSLLSMFSLGTSKLVRWELESIEREGQIQQSAGVTGTMEQLIPQLEEDLKLRGEMSAVKHKREELGQSGS